MWTSLLACFSKIGVAELLQHLLFVHAHVCGADRHGAWVHGLSAVARLHVPCKAETKHDGSDITGLSCQQTAGQSQLGILESWPIFSSRIERVLLGQ